MSLRNLIVLWDMEQASCLMNHKVSFLLGPTYTMPIEPPFVFQAKHCCKKIYNMFPTPIGNCCLLSSRAEGPAFLP